MFIFFFFKQKTAYEMRISDWSSDVCSSDLFARFRDAESDKAGLIEEAIRWTTPVQHFMRSAREDVEIGGQTIREGDWLMLNYVSANRDEDVFGDPFVFDPDRERNQQIAFGFGAHVCLGQHLARMEMRILMEELLPRLEGLELTGDPARVESVFVGGLKHLPIRFTLASPQRVVSPTFTKLENSFPRCV